jgi:hypothetical protein
MPLFMPPTYLKVPKESPYMFLIGPIQGSPDWQNPTAEWFLKREPNMHIASPRSGMWASKLPDDERRKRYLVQTRWEHHNIEPVLKRIKDPSLGCGIIFAWHERETMPIVGRAHAQTTRKEVGLIIGSIAESRGLGPFTGYGERDLPILPHDGIFVGADEAYSGRQYLGDLMNHHRRKFFNSLDEMREEVLAYVMRT